MSYRENAREEPEPHWSASVGEALAVVFFATWITVGALASTICALIWKAEVGGFVFLAFFLGMFALPTIWIFAPAVWADYRSVWKAWKGRK